MQVVATLSLKGGVGKTTVALGLAGAAQPHGVRTLVVDLDPQANATIALDPGPTTATVADVLDEPAPVGDAPRDRAQRLGRRARRAGRRRADRAAQPPRPGRRSSWAGSPAPYRAARPASRSATTGPGHEPYRLVIVDCPPSLGQLTRSALAAAHRAVLVTDPTMFAVSGVQRAFDAVQTERRARQPRTCSRSAW